ncbi:MAG: hypothetical protein GTN74_04185 [Proteobacteria bacterium]|nr:hypothetical protein [Pseudomonadota bacterium]NIS68551.1 hypothetical protein [Pseudomonadota bacterium]
MELRVYLEHLEIWEKDALVAIHGLSGGKGKRVFDPQHRQKLSQRPKKHPERQGPSFLQEPGWPQLQNPEALVHWGVEVERRDLSLYSVRPLLTEINSDEQCGKVFICDAISN